MADKQSRFEKIKESMQEVLYNALVKIAGEPDNAINRSQKYESIDNYWRMQHAKMMTEAVATGFGGFITGTTLSVGAATHMLRCVANMTYAYGYAINAKVEKEDFFFVLALWMDKDKDDIVNQPAKAMLEARARAIAAAQAGKASLKMGQQMIERLARHAARSLAARFATRLVASAAPVVGAVVMARVMSKDYAKITKAIKDFYAQKQEEAKTA